MEFTENQLTLINDNIQESLNNFCQTNLSDLLTFIRKVLVELLRQADEDSPDLEKFKDFVTILAENRGIYLPYYSPTIDLSDTREVTKALEGTSKESLVNLVRLILQEEMNNKDIQDYLFPNLVCLSPEK